VSGAPIYVCFQRDACTHAKLLLRLVHAAQAIQMQIAYELSSGRLRHQFFDPSS
jgi:hypothetical protein